MTAAAAAVAAQESRRTAEDLPPLCEPGDFELDTAEFR